MKRTSFSKKRSKPSTKGCPNCEYCRWGVSAIVWADDGTNARIESVETRFCPTCGCSFEEKYGSVVTGFVAKSHLETAPDVDELHEESQVKDL